VLDDGVFEHARSREMESGRTSDQDLMTELVCS
jgi:hypothetical protein